MNSEVYKATSIDQYLKLLLEMIGGDKVKPSEHIIWFRGESSVNFRTPLVPNGYRTLAETLKLLPDENFNSNNVRQVEVNINSLFYRKAMPFIISKGIENTAWNRYFLMQHYKINTRLLDWTENALLALLFAVTDNPDEDGIVWILRPFELNSFTIKTILKSKNDYPVIPPAIDSVPKKLYNKKGQIRLKELSRRYLEMDFDKDDKASLENTYYPLAIYPSYLDERMRAQKACFTIFGNKLSGLIKINSDQKDILDSIIISKSNKQQILLELQLIGFDYDSIFPDLDGLGISIMNKFKSQFLDNRETLPVLLNKLGFVEE